MSCPERTAKRFQNRMRKVMALEVRGNGPEGTAIPMTPLVLLRKLRRISAFCSGNPAGVDL
jgi:hypothetical protein